ncbi:MAG: hypothetical protein JWO86_7572 [Myxococcaceae bacterium]|jgi:hypothetical protein|nr:hypothetical protein [Myxococcaceae bacterium]
MKNAWLLLIGSWAAACGGGTTQGASIDHLYDEASSDALGVRLLYRLDTSLGESDVELNLREHARLGVRGLMELAGDRRSCNLGERWREVDERRLGFMLHCTDGVDREGIFVADEGSTLLHPPTIAGWFETPVKLESVGADRADEGDEHPPHWASYRFALVRP